MHILLRELKANKRSLAIWAAAIGGLNVLMMAIYPSFTDEVALESLFEMYPESFLKAFGLDVLSLANPINFYATEAYFIVVLFGGIFAAILGASILAKEEEEKTIEFLLSKPITRNQVLSEKILSFIIYIIIFNLLISLFTFAAFEIFVSTIYSRILLFYLLLTPVFAHLTFACIAFLLSIYFSDKRSAYSASIGLVLFLYFINILALLSERAEFLRYLSPFYYTDAVGIVVNNSMNIVNMFILLGVCALSLFITFILYNKRDITV